MASTIWSGTKTFTVDVAADTLVPIPMPHRGDLRRFNVKQTAGALNGFTATLYTSNRATAPNSTLPIESFYLTSISANSGAANTYNEPAAAYQNRDGSPTNAQRFLYLKITGAGSGEKDFACSVTVETPMLR